jgi:ABC-type enterochelin transport system permease subunit
MATITTNEPPVGQPKHYSGTLTTSYVSIITVDNYSVSKKTAGTTTTVTVPGLAEITTPLLLTNKTSTTRWASVRITRSGGSVSFVTHQQKIPANETFMVPLNGQFLSTGDVVAVIAEANSAIDATVSWTQGEAETDGS